MKRDNKTFVKEIRNHLYQYYFNELGLDDWEERVKERINEVKENEKILDTVEHFTGCLDSKNILVVGSGWGGVCAVAEKKRSK